MSDLLNANQLAGSIHKGINKLGMQPENFPVADYVSYLQLLTKWNKAYNLTAITDPGRMVTHHILDSLSVLPYLQGGRCIDVGTGAGLPGLILALATPEKKWVLLDSNQKKIRFINQAIIDLKVNNVTTERVRAEEFKPEILFSTVITRAYGSMELICAQTRHLMLQNGIMLAMKGVVAKKELAGIDKGAFKVQLHKLQVPGVTDQRTLVEINALPSSI